MNILYAGDGEKEGAARYLLSVLKHLKSKVIHIPPKKVLSPSFLKEKFDVVILSDFPCKNLPPSSEDIIIKQVQDGTGLWMIGGWSSFKGLNGNWTGSKIESFLPVKCLPKDDRLNFSAGAWPQVKETHTILKQLSFLTPPVICGINRVKVKKGSKTIWMAREVSKKEYPLLVIAEKENMRSAVLTTDLAPHWCGGLVDWGNRRQTLHWSKDISVEVGHYYIQLIKNLVEWLSCAR